MPDESTAEQPRNNHNRADHLKPHQYRKGQSGNPSGRPVGTVSLKEYARQMLSKMTDEEREEFFHGIDKSEIWRMSEGNPAQDLTSGGEKLTQVQVINYGNPVPIPATSVSNTTSSSSGQRSEEGVLQVASEKREGQDAA